MIVGISYSSKLCKIGAALIQADARGSGGRQPPSKNNFMDPEPGPNSIFFISLILQLLTSGTCPRYIHQGFTIDSRWNWDRYTIIKLTNMGEKYFQESDLRIWVKNMFRNLVLALGP